MNELIKIEGRPVGTEVVQTVAARELHEYLGVAKDFTSWIKAQLKRSRLIDGRDYISGVFTQKGENPLGGRPMNEYHLTIDAAKHIAMMSGTEKGYEVRDYFIECERRALARPAVDPMQVLNDPAAMRGLLLGYTEKVLDLEGQLEATKPKVEALDRIAESKSTYCLREAAKVLQLKESDCLAYLQAQGWIYRNPGNGNWLGYSARRVAGHLVHKVYAQQIENREPVERVQVRVTSSGLVTIAKMLASKTAKTDMARAIALAHCQKTEH